MAASAYLVVLAFVVSQSLGELAKTEKQRRGSSGDRAEPARTFTNDDLDEGSEGVEAPPQKSAEPPAVSSAPQSDSSLEAWRSRKEADKTAWKGKLAEYQARYAEEKGRLDLLLRVKAQCASDQMPVSTLVANSSRQGDVSWYGGPESCEAIPGRIAESEKKLHAIETECAADARRRSIPRSEARLF